MKKALSLVVTRYGLIALFLIAVVAYAGYQYFGTGNTDEELLTVAPSTFVQTVSVSGKVEAVQDVDLGFAQGGRVARVSAQVGSFVNQRAVLAETENGDVVSLVAQKEAALQVVEAELSALTAGTRSEEIGISEADVAAKKIAYQQAALSALEEAQDAYTATDNAINTNIDQLFTSSTGATPQLAFSVSNSNTENAVEAGRAAVGLLLTTWKPHAFSITENVLAERIAEAKLNLATVSSFLALTNTAVNEGFATGSVTQAVLSGYGTDVSVARTNINTAISALTAAETAWVNAGAALATAEKTLALKKAGATRQDIAAQEARVKSARAAVLDAEAQLRKTRIVAPFPGTVTEIAVKVGEVAQSNTPVISLMTTSDVIVETYIPELNVSLVAVGDPAEITLDAYGVEVQFSGIVESIDPAETVRDGASTYRTRLRFELPDARIRPGMTANISIVADKREGVLSIPQKVVSTRDGVKYVTVKQDDTYEARVVTTGAISSLGTIEILSGLSSGDTVVLTPLP